MMEETVILEEQTLAFADQGDGFYSVTVATAAVLTAGETYRVVWDGAEYQYTAFETDGMTGIGEETCDPFAVAFIPKEWMDADTNMLGISTVSNDSSHTLSIYQVAEEQADILLIDRGMNEYTYSNTVLRVPTTDGGTRDFTEGTAVEKTVELDFSGGDVEVIPGAGELFKKILIPVPAGLVAENIPEGVTIAGIVGSLIANAPKEIKYASGTIPSRSEDYTVEHGLGVTPDIVILSASGNQKTSTTETLRIFIGLSSAMAAAIGNVMYGYYGSTQYVAMSGSTYGYKYTSNLIDSSLLASTSALIDTTSNGWYSVIREADSEKFVLTYSTLMITITTNSSMTYNWIAIGGLT